MGLTTAAPVNAEPAALVVEPASVKPAEEVCWMITTEVTGTFGVEATNGAVVDSITIEETGTTGTVDTKTDV